jgi:molybdate transport system substrate-binding protein
MGITETRDASSPNAGFGGAAMRDGPCICGRASLDCRRRQLAAGLGRSSCTDHRTNRHRAALRLWQIAQGAPFEMLLAADEISIQKLAEAGHTRDASHVFALGRLALFAPRGSVLDPAAGLEALRPLLAAGRVQRFAIANPETAPYGRAAEQALRSLELWEALRPRLIFGENIAQAAQFAMTEGASGGLVAYSLALSPALKARGSFSLVPANLHDPLRHRLALTRRASDAALRLQAWFLSPQAAAVFARHGLEKP